MLRQKAWDIVQKNLIPRETWVLALFLERGANPRKYYNTRYHLLLGSVCFKKKKNLRSNYERPV